MTAICKSSIKAKAIRVVKVDSCGNPVAGIGNMAIAEGFVHLNLDPDIEDGQEFVVKTADGDLCINDKDRPRLKRYNVELELCSIDPELIALLTGNRLVTRSGDPVSAIGLGIGELDSSDGVSIEVWTRISGGDCGAGNDRYFHWVLPWVRNAILGSFNFENGPLAVTVNADTQANPNYGTGPFSQFVNAVASDEHLAWEITSEAPPAGSCGAQEVILS